jgi:MtN3 and saliva related transmembrane protein
MAERLKHLRFSLVLSTAGSPVPFAPEQFAHVVGWLATVASTVSFLPQAWKIVRTRNTGDISTGMYLVTVIGFALWTTYGVLLGAWPLIVANGLCLLFSGFILMMKLLPRRDVDAVADVLDPDAAPGSPHRPG